MNICVIMWYDENVKEYAELNYIINKTYCDKYGYNIIKSDLKRTSLSPHWERIPLAIEHLNNYDYVIWIDSDANFLKDAPPITNVIKEHNEKLFILSGDVSKKEESDINTGFFIVKNSPICFEILKFWYTDLEVIANKANKYVGNVASKKQDIVNNMDMLKKKFIYISKNNIEDVKNLIRYYGATYYDAPGEADELCALLVIKNKVWACLSEDMDMFVYGCTRVLRYLSLLNHTVVLYDTKEILDNLGISQKELREICVLSGTDYNYISDNNSKNAPTLYKTLSYFKKYHNEKSDIDFYSWLLQKRDYIKDYDMLIKIYDMFDLNKNNNSKLKNFENIKIGNGPILKDEIKLIIQKEGFIFPLNKN